MKEFKYDISKFEFDFYGDSKIDVLIEEEIILEIYKIDNSLWLIQTFQIHENLIPIKTDLSNQLISLVKTRVIEQFDSELPVVLHPNFFMILDNLHSN